MVPTVSEGDMCKFKPVGSEDSIKAADVVFCQVQLGNEFFAQHVVSIVKTAGACYFDIGYCRAVGTELVGYCELKDIYGNFWNFREHVRKIQRTLNNI